MEQIDPNDLLVFAHVADLGSFSQAASKMGWPKSTVSRRLAALEQRLGERLLLRTTRRQTLTEFGQQLLEHARQVVAEVDAVASLREHRQSAPSGRLRVSMPSDYAHLLLTDALAQFVIQHPAITLELDLSARRVDLLGEGFDLAIRIGALPDDNTLAARRLHESRIGLYASPAYIARQGDPQHPDELAAHEAVHLLGSNGDVVRWTLQRGDVTWNGLPPARIAANSMELLIRMVGAGLGLAAIPEHLAQSQACSGQVRRVLPDWQLPSPVVSAVFPGRKLMPAKTRVFLDMLQTVFTAAPPVAAQR